MCYDDRENPGTVVINEVIPCICMRDTARARVAHDDLSSQFWNGKRDRECDKRLRKLCTSLTIVLRRVSVDLCALGTDGRDFA